MMYVNTEKKVSNRVLQLLKKGWNLKEISEKLEISKDCIVAHITAMKIRNELQNSVILDN